MMKKSIIFNEMLGVPVCASPRIAGMSHVEKV
jgi:hypothetical protein